MYCIPPDVLGGSVPRAIIGAGTQHMEIRDAFHIHPDA
jgi:hypothetical protein